MVFIEIFEVTFAIVAFGQLPEREREREILNKTVHYFVYLLILLRRLSSSFAFHFYVLFSFLVVFLPEIFMSYVSGK